MNEFGTDETKDIRSSEHASLYTCSALEAFSPNGQENPSGMDVDSEVNSLTDDSSVNNKLEKLTQNHYTDIPPTPKLKSTHPAQTDTTSERANDCEDSGLPPGEDGSLKVASNAECTQTEEALSTLKPTCPAAQSPPKVMEKQTPNSMDTQEPSTFHNSSTEPGDVSSDKVAYMKKTGKECSNTYTKCPRLNYLKRVQQQSTPSLVSENVLQTATLECEVDVLKACFLETSDNGTAKDLQISQNEVSRDLKTEVRARNLNSEKIEGVVVDPNLLEDTSETLSSYGELQVDNHENSDITGNPEQESKRKALTGVANEEPTLRDAEICSPKVFCAESNNMLVNAAVKEVPFALSTSSSSKSKNKDVKVVYQ
ncbi:hypothetical protein NFI96_002765 [Prochilodus magdalenae]|nr:hypothetical protein NFI96_002765 [Prochilodus magdalenae]